MNLDQLSSHLANLKEEYGSLLDPLNKLQLERFGLYEELHNRIQDCISNQWLPDPSIQHVILRIMDLDTRISAIETQRVQLFTGMYKAVFEALGDYLHR